MGVFCRGDREGSGGVFRRLCVGMILGWDFYWFRVGRGCDVFLWGGRVLKGRSWGRVDVLVWLRCMRCDCTMLVCICVEFTEICCCVTVSGCVSMLVV